MFSADDEKWMQRAIELAATAASQNEVPVGAVLVQENRIIGEGFNRPITSSDPTSHAEIVALRYAAANINNYRLLNTTLYVTLEPCLMCAGAMVHARIGKVIFGASDPKAGVVHSKAAVLDHAFLNHRVAYAGGLYSEHCGKLLSDFFLAKRR